MHCSTPLYTGDLSSHRFGICEGPGTSAPQIPRDHKFCRVRSHNRIFDYMECGGGWVPAPLTPVLFTGQLYVYL